MEIEKLKKLVSESKSLTNLCEKYYGYNNSRLMKEMKQILIDNQLTLKKQSAKLKYEFIIKTCPVCNQDFKTQLGYKDEKTVCSRSCSNSYFKFGVNNPNFDKEKLKDFKNKISAKLKGKPSPKKGNIISKNCLNCNKEFTIPIYSKKIYCCKKCSDNCIIKKQNLSNIVKKNIEEGKHNFWPEKNKMSYAEKYFKKLLEDNNINFIYNYKILQSNLGIENGTAYYLDFYITKNNIKIDLEIDGKQHEWSERIIHDNIRNQLLTENGYIVYRIKWKGIRSKKNSELMIEESDKFINFFNSL